MRTCIVCGKEFIAPATNFYRLTCSRECLCELNKRNYPTEFIEHQFKKGNIPFNKGLTQKEWMSESGRDKCSKTHIQYQKGCLSPFAQEENRYLPHNTKAKGTVTKRIHLYSRGKNKGKVDYDYYINIDWKGNRKPNNSYKKYLWEVEHQQDLPKGYIVYCIDGNPNHLVPENLTAITRRELLRLNTGK